MTGRVSDAPLARAALWAYWTFTVGGLCALVFAVLAYERYVGERDHRVLAYLFLGGLGGTALGNLLALRRVRVVVVLAAAGLLCLVPAVLAKGGAGGEIWALFYAFVFGTACGHLALQHRFELAASFLPVVGWGGAILVILNSERRASVWAEDKVSAWLPVPLLLLALGSVAFVAFLAGNQAHRLAVWQALGTARRPSARVAVARRRRRGRGSLLAVVVIGLFAFGASAVLSPYLWRTGRGDRPADDGAPSRATGDEDDGSSGSPLDWERLGEAVIRVVEQVKETGKRWLPFIPIMFLNRPARRLWLLRQLRRPLWRVSPTARVEGLWRLVRIACADAGVRPRPQDSIAELVARAGQRLPPEEAGRLAALGARYRRVRYGLGIPPGEPRALLPEAERAFRALRADLTAWQRVASWFRRLDE